MSLSAFAQTPTDTNNVDEKDDDNIYQKIESIAEKTDTELDFLDLLNQLKIYQEHPLNLNFATAEELKQLIFLNDIQIHNLLEHIRKNGKLMTVYELQTIDGFTSDVIYKILPYIYVSDNISQPHFSFKEMCNYGNNQVIFRYQRVLEEQAGFLSITDSIRNINPNSRYLGSPEKLYLKYDFNYYNNINWGITAEKDAGEEFFKGTQKNGFDFYSAHLCIRNMGFVKTLAIGDYNVLFGQGLTLWSGMGFGKSSDVIDIKKNTIGITPFTSIEENKFMRGIATTIGTKHLEWSLFYSSHKIDGNILIYDSLNNKTSLISSLQETGIHSTPNELSDKHSVNETLFGGYFTYKNQQLTIGTTAYKTLFSAELQRDTQPYNQFQFEGKENINVGIDYSYSLRNSNFFGEVSRSNNGTIAYINGMLICLDPKFSLSFLHRNYPKNYQNIFCNAFAENSTIANEKALYIGFVAKPHYLWTLTTYADNFTFPYMKYRTDAPSRGNDYLIQLDYKPSKKIEMYLRYREESKQINNSGNNVINYLDNTLKQNIRFNMTYPISQAFNMKNRVEFSNYKIGENAIQYGYLIYQDVSYKKLNSPFTFSFRYAIFYSDTYDSRLYAFENDMLCSYSIPSFYYKGSRTYLLLHYRINHYIDLWLRYAQTYYSNKNGIGAGLTQINDNTRSEIKTQIRIKI